MRRWQVRARAVTLSVPSQVETAWSGATMVAAAALACEGNCGPSAGASGARVGRGGACEGA